MDDALEDEVMSINAIYGPDTLSRTSDSGELYTLRIPDTDITLRLSFPDDYPIVAPTIHGPEASGAEIRKGEARETADIAGDVLTSTFKPGEPCIFELLEELKTILQSHQAPVDNDQDTRIGELDDHDQGYGSNMPESSERLASHVPEPPWTLSEVVTEKKSTFVARAAPVTSTLEARSFIQHLVTTDKKAARATHNITAWRIRDAKAPDVTFQDCDDDGESAAGGRLLHLLQLMDVWNVMVVVTRWYGGIHLGPDRFRIINTVARDAIVRGGFAEPAQAAGTNDRKGKR